MRGKQCIYAVRGKVRVINIALWPPLNMDCFGKIHNFPECTDLKLSWFYIKVIHSEQTKINDKPFLRVRISPNRCRRLWTNVRKCIGNRIKLNSVDDLTSLRVAYNGRMSLLPLHTKLSRTSEIYKQFQWYCYPYWISMIVGYLTVISPIFSAELWSNYACELDQF